MRTHHIVAIATVLAVGLGAKLFFLSSPTADASAVNSASMDISRMHQNAENLPVLKVHDMSVGVD